tara:strand:+ start:1171 stop:1371 length:201 start_codon:yes stop_codon:yes gene_type:complete
VGVAALPAIALLRSYRAALAGVGFADGAVLKRSSSKFPTPSPRSDIVSIRFLSSEKCDEILLGVPT